MWVKFYIRIEHIRNYQYAPSFRN